LFLDPQILLVDMPAIFIVVMYVDHNGLRTHANRRAHTAAEFKEHADKWGVWKPEGRTALFTRVDK
jgi:hypothetical protein